VSERLKTRMFIGIAGFLLTFFSSSDFRRYTSNPQRILML
jgi:hypothetical protein